MLKSSTYDLQSQSLHPRLRSRTRRHRFAKTIRRFCFASQESVYLLKIDHHSHRQDELTTSIRLLNTLALKLKAKRMAAGALNLASPEVKIHLDSSESSDPIDVEQKEMRETNSLVEEFMLLANISVARKIEETFPQTAVLRQVVTRRNHLMQLLNIIIQTAFTSSPNQFREITGYSDEEKGHEVGCFKFRSARGFSRPMC